MVTIYLEGIVTSVHPTARCVLVLPHVQAVFVENMDQNATPHVTIAASTVLVLVIVQNVYPDDMVQIVIIFALLDVEIYFVTNIVVNARGGADMVIT